MSLTRKGRRLLLVATASCVSLALMSSIAMADAVNLDNAGEPVQSISGGALLDGAQVPGWLEATDAYYEVTPLSVGEAAYRGAVFFSTDAVSVDEPANGTSSASVPQLVAEATWCNTVDAALRALCLADADGGTSDELLVPSDRCPQDWACLFADAAFKGRMLKFRDVTSYWQNLHVAPYYFNDQMSAWRNRKAKDAKWSENADGGGFQRCMNTFTRNSYVGQGDNDKATAIRITSSPDTCV